MISKDKIIFTDPVVSKAAIIGLGLIGGSLGIALNKAGFAQEIIGVDVDSQIVQQALEKKAITTGTTSFRTGVKDADLVIICVPAGSIYPVVKELLPHLKDNCIVTDVGSIKEDIVNMLEELCNGKCEFVGGHPMAGSEQKGIAAAHQYLFENAYYILTPTANTSQQGLDMVSRMIEATGANRILISPDVHDRIVAAISHLPHIVAVCLVNSVAQMTAPSVDPLSLAAGGFRDTTRIASSDPNLWRDICFGNKEKILSELEIFSKSLQRIQQALINDDQEDFVQCFQKAKLTRDKIPAKQKGLLPEIHGVLVTVPDQPGQIGLLAQILGQTDINILDIEILRVREGIGGTIKLGFISAEIAERACTTLIENNVVASLI